MWLGPLPLLCDRRDHRVGAVMTGVRIRCEAWSLTGGMRVNVERYQRHALTPHAKAVPRYRLTRRPCGGGCACGRGARAQKQNRSQNQRNQQNRNQRAASARHGHGHECRGRSGRPYRRSACDRRPASRDATRANAPLRKRSRATNDHGHHASHHASRRNPNARPGLVPRSGERSHPGPRGPRRPGRRACAWRAAGDRLCPPGCPGR